MHNRIGKRASNASVLSIECMRTLNSLRPFSNKLKFADITKLVTFQIHDSLHTLNAEQMHV